jgi:hypothetical protein
MAFNGSGTYSLPAGNPVVTGTTISSTTTNNTNSDIATALTNCITRDGQSPATADLPMGANKLIDLADGSTAGDSIAYGQAYSSTYIDFTQLGSTTSRTVQDKLYDAVSVKDFGALGNGVANDYAAFLAAVAALSSTGGTIIVPPGVYKLNTTLTWGTKSIYWDISPSATFTGTGTGAGKFPAMVTNTSQLAVGPFIQSTSAVTSPSGGGIAAFNVEMLQPASYVGQSVGIYAGSQGSGTSSSSNVWSINALITANTGAGGTYQAMEVDVNNFSTSALVKGISINGVGTTNPAVGLEVMRTGTGAGASWVMGINVRNSLTAIKIESSGLSKGIVIGETSGFDNCLFQGKQLVNGSTNDMIALQRLTDTSSAGFFIRGINAANSSTMFSINVSGGAIFASTLQATNIRATDGAITMGATGLSLGATSSTTASTGTRTLPANPLGFLVAFLGATEIRIPYYGV